MQTVLQAILTYLSVPSFHIIFVSRQRFHAYDFYRADVGLLGRQL